MMRIFLAYIFLLLLATAFVEPNILVTAAVLPFLAASGGVLRADLNQSITQKVSAFHIANNEPYVHHDIDETLELTPSACLASPLSLACKEDLDRMCTDPGSQFFLVKNNLDNPEVVVKKIRETCGSGIVGDAALEANVGRYIDLLKMRLIADYPRFHQITHFLNLAVPKDLPVEGLARTKFLIRGLQTAFFATYLPIEKGIGACMEVAAVTYLELLEFQKRIGQSFSIFKVAVYTKTKGGIDYDHAFLVLNAPESWVDGKYKASQNKGGRLTWESLENKKKKMNDFKDAYILDPYYKTFVAFGDERAPFLQRGLRASHLEISQLPDHRHIQALDTQPFGQFSFLFKLVLEDFQNSTKKLIPTQAKDLSRAEL